MKSRISPALMMCALVLGAASPAFAQQQDDNGPGQHDDRGQGHRGDRGGSHDQGPGGRGGRDDGRGGNRQGDNGPGGNGPGGNGPGGHFAGDRGPGGPGGGDDRGGHREWNRGDRYDGNRQFVDDWRGRGLREPPRGHRWVRDEDGDYVLVALASGIIADILLNNGR